MFIPPPHLSKWRSGRCGLDSVADITTAGAKFPGVSGSRCDLPLGDRGICDMRWLISHPLGWGKLRVSLRVYGSFVFGTKGIWGLFYPVGKCFATARLMRSGGFTLEETKMAALPYCGDLRS